MIHQKIICTSNKMKQEIKVDLLLPDIITDKTKTLIFLHGAMESARNILDNSSIIEFSDFYQVAVVLPSMGNSFYLDVAHDFLVNELVLLLQRKFNLAKNRNQTILGGYSMGGYGAFYNALRRPDLFSQVFSFSGAMDISYCVKFVGHLDNNLPEYTKKSKQQLHEDYDCLPLFSNEFNQRYYLSCGKDDALLYFNRKFVSELEIKQIHFDYFEKEGTHDWNFWRKELIAIFEWIK